MEEGESASTKMRIYVGGLGAAMTEDDLRKVFKSVGGVVEAVDFIRSKSRSFAYVDFFPSSQSSVSKLFSTVSFFLLDSIAELSLRCFFFFLFLPILAMFLLNVCLYAYLAIWLRF